LCSLGGGGTVGSTPHGCFEPLPLVGVQSRCIGIHAERSEARLVF